MKESAFARAIFRFLHWGARPKLEAVQLLLRGAIKLRLNPFDVSTMPTMQPTSFRICDWETNGRRY